MCLPVPERCAQHPQHNEDAIDFLRVGRAVQEVVGRAISGGSRSCVATNGCFVAADNVIIEALEPAANATVSAGDVE